MGDLFCRNVHPLYAVMAFVCAAIVLILLLNYPVNRRKERKAGEGLLTEHAFKIGRFLGWYYGKEHTGEERAKIVIGKDTRRSSYTFENGLAAGITASGKLLHQISLQVSLPVHLIFPTLQ